MYLIVGKESCPRCEAVKKILIDKKVVFEFRLLDELPNKLQSKYIDEALSKGFEDMPIVVDKNGNVVDFKEII